MLENIMVWDVLWKWIQYRDINEFKDINNTSLLSPVNGLWLLWYYFMWVLCGGEGGIGKVYF